MTILAATDYSPLAKLAVDIAAELARARGEQLIVMHLAEGPAAPADRTRMVEEEARLATAGVQPPLRVRALLEEGKVTGARFAEIVRATNASLVVVGAHGSGARPPLGTIAQSIVRHVPEPLLVVREPQRMLGLVFQRRLRALASLSLDATDDGVVAAARLLAASCDIDVELVHYRSVPESPARARSDADLERDVRRSFGDAGPRIHVGGVHIRDGFGRLDAHLADLAKELDVDLVIAGSHHRHGIDRMREGSVAEGFIARAPVSVLIGRAPV